MKFRNDISFLRAISVIAVLLYHYNFSFFKGGFIGVDIFFVISGYLMTRIILTGFSKNNFSILDFYKKRVVRIFPALIVMITFFAVVIYFLLPIQFINYTKLYFSSSLFFSNIYYYLNSGYFDSSSKFNFLLHTWSLSVEWQFYMIYPLILIIFKRFYLQEKRKFNLIFLALIILSITSMLIHNIFSNSYSFYMFYPRAWEMMFGGLAFLFANSFDDKSSTFKKNIFYVSLSVIALFIVFTNEHTVKWPSLITLIPVAFTTQILLLNIDIKLFNNKIVKYVGDISYSLYLWHWPFYVLSLYFALNDRIRYRIIFIILSLIFAIISYHVVEKRNYNNKHRLVLSSTAILFILSFAISKLNANYLFNKNMANLISATTDYKYSEQAYKQFSLENKHLAHYQTLKDYNFNNLKINNNKKNIILLGDSHAAMFSQTINNIFKNDKYNLIQATADATYPMINSETPYEGPKDFFNFFFEDYFPKNYNKIDLVIISSNYYGYYKDDLIKKIKFTENYFKKYNIPVIYLGQTDNYPTDFPTHFYLKNDYNVESINTPQLQNKVYAANKLLLKILGNRYINLLDYKIAKVNKDGTPYIYDQNHLTYYGTEQYRSFIVKSLSLK
ncbi:Peptidoglycan/LPS O-acetylase OafA/YrhL, contains acyltransferase and SGNH-hydrolase domains [Chryseobacterium wanjuense]|uniref:Peptidoglycan/LPS O-acetylase OafA/YrhL, contains acyltransferase and SGNH-hydrolase domains n=1 Tax=Chryseobacterium wanjuense TaxID=356305 RepID=A0A1I0S1I6_9FLAO|nr:acyltransferase family protein [Chryseobacterium wanjuense]SEW48314.1 Peptidoglycan/LPS O-acetylase OafA/YrhL, contains acyltransferase and SGNH-hydrolase domains [Chryseobacterium wanjuense]